MGLALFTSFQIVAAPKPAATGGKSLTGKDALDIAMEAYVFGYPLVTMDMTRRVMTNVREPDGMHAPLGQFARIRTYPLASNHDVSVPNADMLYTIIWLDVSKEPWLLSLPDMKITTIYDRNLGDVRLWVSPLGSPDTIEIGAVPEPAMLGLTAFASLAMMRRRRRAC